MIMRAILIALLLLARPVVGGAQILGAPPAPIEAPYQTEQAWALREITGDINEMVRYRGKTVPLPAAVAGILPWHPELLTAYAAAQLGAIEKFSASEPGDQHDKLLDLTAEAILKANIAVSAALKRDMRNPRAHEAAA